MKTKVALIAHDFPPYNVGGSQRPYLMAKAMAEAGIEVFIFTLKEECYKSERLNFEYNLDQYSNITIIRTAIDNKSSLKSDAHYFNLVDDTAARWKNHLISAIQENNLAKPFDVLLFTCPPFSLAKHAANISKKTKILFALDFRDAWSQWIMSPYASYLHYKLLLRLEKNAIDKALFVSSTSQQQIQDFKKVHQTNFNDKFIYVPNGFIDFINSSIIKNSTKLRIVYTGSFYYNPYSQELQSKKWYQKKWYQWLQFLPRVEDWSYRSPLYFFKIVQKISEVNPMIYDKLQIIFAGEKPDWFEKMLVNYNLQDKVEHYGFINKSDTQVLLNQADYLLITSSKIPNGREYSVAGKTFEYLSTQKPIIAILSEGEQKDVLIESGSAIILDPDNTNQSAEKLLKALLGEEHYLINKEYCSKFMYPANFQSVTQKLQNLTHS